MHTFKAKETLFHYNADMSGEVRVVSKETVVDINADDIIEFMGNYLKNELAGIKNMSQAISVLKNTLRVDLSAYYEDYDDSCC